MGVQEQYEALQQDLMRKRREAIARDDSLLAYQIREARIAADEFKSAFMEFERELLRKRRLVSMRRPGISLTHPEINFPTLFRDNVKVTHLFARNIRDRTMTKDKLKELFREFDITDCEVTRIILSFPIAAEISCGTLASACKLQCLSTLGKLRWEYVDNNDGELKSGKIIIAPDERIANKKSRTLSIAAPLSHAQLLQARVTRNVLILTQLSGHLNITDLYNLYLAVDEPKEIEMVVNTGKVTSSWPPFRGPNCIPRLSDHLALRLPKIIDFSNKYEGFGVTVLKRVLQIIIRNYAKGGKVPVQLMNLSGVVVSETIIKMICDYFQIRSVVCEESTKQFETGFTQNTLIRLFVSHNDYFTMKSLRPNIFSSLVHLKVTDCKRLELHTLASFLHNSTTLTTLEIIDCIWSRQHPALITLLNAIFSDKSNLSQLNFSYTREPGGDCHPLVLNGTPLMKNCKLQKLGLKFNRFLKFLLPNILNCTSQVRELDIIGIYHDATLSLRHLKDLQKLSVQYTPALSTIIGSVHAQNMKTITVKNLYGISNKSVKAIDLNSLQRFFSINNNVIINLVQCKIAKPFPMYLATLIAQNLVAYNYAEQTRTHYFVESSLMLAT